MVQRRMTRAEEADLVAALLRRPDLMQLSEQGQRFHDGGLVGRRDECIPVECYPRGDQVIPPGKGTSFTITVTGRFVPGSGPPVLDGEYQDITQSGKPALPQP